MTPENDKVPADSHEALWLAAAARVARQMPLGMSPVTRDDDGDLYYGSIEDVAREFADPDMREAEAQLDRCFETLQGAGHPADVQAIANELYRPQIDAAYWIGVAVGVRLGRALEGGADLATLKGGGK